MKERLDVLLVKRNLAESREKAKAIIMSGNVFVEGQREDKAGTTFSDEVQIEIKGHTLPYVSRGGLKLEKAIKTSVWKGKSARTWALRLVVLQTVCCKTGQEKCLPLMSEKDSLRGN